MAESDKVASSEGGGKQTASSGPSAPAAVAPPPPPAPPGGDADDDEMMLVTEFPPPPYYYHLASRSAPPDRRLRPPEIPRRAFRVAARRVVAQRRRAREESERIRLESEGAEGGGAAADADVARDGAPDRRPQAEDDDDSIDPDDEDEPVVAVFGEIVEDPTLTAEEECHDPAAVRENVRRLNRSVLRRFLDLVRKLARDPADGKRARDELSHNIFLMLQECNKFREHQAREILIAALEEQLEERTRGLDSLRKQIGEADDALEKLREFRSSE